MKIDFEKINKIVRVIKKAQTDPLVAFLAEAEKEELIKLQENNLRVLFRLAEKYDIRFLFIGKGELSGCEGKKQPGSPWPAIWAIANTLGFSSCGNSDQYQTNDFDGLCFPSDAYGGWDLVENRKLTPQESIEKKFRRVVTREQFRHNY